MNSSCPLDASQNTLPNQVLLILTTLSHDTQITLFVSPKHIIPIYFHPSTQEGFYPIDYKHRDGWSENINFWNDSANKLLPWILSRLILPHADKMAREFLNGPHSQSKALESEGFFCNGKVGFRNDILVIWRLLTSDISASNVLLFSCNAGTYILWYTLRCSEEMFIVYIKTDDSGLLYWNKKYMKISLKEVKNSMKYVNSWHHWLVRRK